MIISPTATGCSTALKTEGHEDGNFALLEGQIKEVNKGEL